MASSATATQPGDPPSHRDSRRPPASPRPGSSARPASARIGDAERSRTLDRSDTTRGRAIDSWDVGSPDTLCHQYPGVSCVEISLYKSMKQHEGAVQLFVTDRVRSQGAGPKGFAASSAGRLIARRPGFFYSTGVCEGRCAEETMGQKTWSVTIGSEPPGRTRQGTCPGCDPRRRILSRSPPLTRLLADGAVTRAEAAGDRRQGCGSPRATYYEIVVPDGQGDRRHGP